MANKFEALSSDDISMTSFCDNTYFHDESED